MSTQSQGLSPAYNPYGSPAANGLNPAAPDDYVDVDFTYPYDVALAGSQELLNQAVSTTNDADFAVRGIVVAFNTGSFNIRVSDSQGYYLSNGYVASANLAADAASPIVVFPELLIPAGGRIGVDIEDTSAAPNTIQILFRGVKRYRISALPPGMP
jgi:hypothetical protein